MLEPINEPNRSYENEPVDLEYDFDPRREQHNETLVARVSVASLYRLLPPLVAYRLSCLKLTALLPD
jgi:hypothetical protein